MTTTLQVPQRYISFDVLNHEVDGISDLGKSHPLISTVWCSVCGSFLFKKEKQCQTCVACGAYITVALGLQ